jgi:hypothetical protein
MANKIRIKQVDLEGVISASAQIDLTSASNYISFVTQLDTTLSSDVELAEVSSSISQSINSINQIINSGLISGSSQLTSSYDSRYVLSGSITQTTWNNIDGKPSGLVSSSDQVLGGTGILSGSHTDISSLNDFTSSYFTDSSSFDTRVLTEKGRIDAILSASNANTDTFAEIVSLINSVDLENDNSFANFYTSSNARISSIENVTSSYETKGSGIVSGSSQLTSSFDERYMLSGSSVSINTGSFATTGSNTFNGNQIISGGLYVTSIATISSSFELPSGSSLLILSGSNIYVDSSGSITGSLSGSVFGIGDVVAFSSSVDNRINNIVSAPDGTISGSSQLTSSYDSRYSLSGSVLTSFSSSVDNRLDTLEATIISGSINYTQVLGNKRTNITTTGVSIISGSITTSGNPVQVMVTGDANPTSTGWTRLQLYRGENPIGNIIQVENEANQNVPYCLNIIDTPSAGTHTYSMRTVSGISGVFDFGEADGPLLTIAELKSNTQLPSGLISGSSQLTSSFDERYALSGSNGGASVTISDNAPSSPTEGDLWWKSDDGNLYVYYDSYWIISTDTIAQLPNGVISGSSQLTSSFDERYTLSGSVQPLPNGLISGSSQLTSSFDERYALSGSGGSIPDGTVSGSSQLTSSYDGRYILTSSFNSFTASAQTVTTGSNSFNGTQTITGSLIVTTGSFVGSQITANTSSLYLTSGSNLYVQNDAFVEITGSLIATSITGSIAATNGIISGSSQLTSAFPSKTIGSWSVPAGASTQSFQVDSGHTYTMWVNGNIPNGIITWNATVTTSNTNVPVAGSQYGWYYVDGGALVLTSIPAQIVGVNGAISTTSFATTTSNTFEFGITNNSETTQTINYGYIKLS